MDLWAQEWRQTNAIDKILETKPPKQDLLRKLLPHAHHGVDRYILTVLVCVGVAAYTIFYPSQRGSTGAIREEWTNRPWCTVVHVYAARAGV